MNIIAPDAMYDRLKASPPNTDCKRLTVYVIPSEARDRSPWKAIPRRFTPRDDAA